MSYRSHWTAVEALSVATIPGTTVPGAVDDVTADDVLVLFDHGNQEAFVIEGDPHAWEHLADLIRLRVRKYREDQRRCVETTQQGALEIRCRKDKGHLGQHWGLNRQQLDIVWDSVTLSPPAQEDT